MHIASNIFFMLVECKISSTLHTARLSEVERIKLHADNQYLQFKVMNIYNFLNDNFMVQI